ncbi:SAM-dependent methyltransferase, partial [Enterococcus lactis]|uniref:SAM-dependent methyltransferase n=2 Tax=Bacteria TaxID=2 RepID=UPI0034E9691C
TVLFELFMRNRRTLGGAGRAQGAMRLLRHWRNGLRRNSRTGSKRNIEFHYDLGNDFYRLWLDPSLTYSSALFAEPVVTEESLEAAQARKNEAILDR